VRLHRGLAIRGRVLTPSGEPAKYASIRISGTTSGVFGQENMNDPEGRFVLGPLEAGEVTLRASSMGDFVDSESVAARPGDVDFVLRFRTGGALRGLVVNKTDGAPTAATVLVRDHAGTGVSMPRANAQGVFELAGLAPGLYDVSASTSNGAVGLARDIEVTAGASRDVRVEVEASARVRVRYAGPWPNVGISVYVGDALFATNGMPKGTETTLTAPVGAIVVRIRNYAEKTEFDLPLVLTVGETRDVVFDGTWK